MDEFNLTDLLTTPFSNLINATENVTYQTGAEDIFMTTSAPKTTSVDISTKVSYVTVPVFTIFGLTGNILTLIIMRTKYFRASTTSVFLSALSLSDTTFILISPFTKAFMKDIFNRDPKALTEAGCKAYFCIFRSAKICSSWYVVLVCLERFMVICFPFRAKIIFHKRSAIIAVSFVTAAVLAFDAVWTITSGIVDGNCIPSIATESTKDLAAGFVVAGTAIFNIIPTCVLLFFTPLSIIQLFRQMSFRRETSTTSGNEDMLKVTRMLLAVTIAYILLVTPISVAHSVAFFNGYSIFTSKDPDFVIFREFAQTFEQLNYSINFFLYVTCNTTFRRQFYNVIRCRRQEIRSALPTANFINKDSSAKCPNSLSSDSTASTQLSE